MFGTRGAHVTARVTRADRGVRARSVERPRRLAWGRVIHDALRVAESTKSMNYALCSIRRDRGVAELVHEPGPVNCAPGGRGLRGGSRAVRRISGHHRHDSVVAGEVVDHPYLPVPPWVSSTVRGELALV